MTTTISSGGGSVDGPTFSMGIHHRRRDKRRHSPSTTMTAVDLLRDPYSILQLAIRLDESFQDESLLRVPLESASIYNQKLFTKALQCLQKTAGPPPKLRQMSSSGGGGSSAVSDEPVALTPIIFSGLLSTIREQQNEFSSASNQQQTLTSIPSSSELVSYCQSMRQAAIARIKIRNQRRKIRRTMTPLLFILGVMILCYTTLSNLKHALIDYDFVDDTCSSSTACRLHSVPIWTQVLGTADILKDCTIKSCSIVADEGQVVEYPVYALHTILEMIPIPLDEVGESIKQRRRIQQQQQQRTHNSHSKRSSSSLSAKMQLSPVQWLGETTVNSLVRDAIIRPDKQRSSSSSSSSTSSRSTLKVLDVGCGVGGTLYSLLNTNNHPQQQKQQFVYHGIALAAPEIKEARRLIELHQLSEISPSDKDDNNIVIQFQQHDYNNPLVSFGGKETNYNSMVAIESLSFSHNITTTLTNLASSMEPKGILVIVDDVVSTWAKNSERVRQIRKITERPSLLTYSEWVNSLDVAGFQIKTVRDLGLEMEVLLSPPTKGLFSELLGNWRYRTAEFIMQRWPLGDDATVWQKTLSRTIQLVQDVVKKARGSSLRYDAFKDATLTYYMIIAEKQ